MELDHRLLDSGLKILFKARGRLEIRIAESLCMLKDKPQLKNNSSCTIYYNYILPVRHFAEGIDTSLFVM